MADGTGTRELRPDAVHRAASWAAVAVLAATAVLGANPAGLRERLVGPDAVEPATGRNAEGRAPTADAEPTTTDGTVLRSNPWWQQLRATSVGDGDPLSFTVAEQALQWRIAWSCDQGTLQLVAATGESLVDATCPDSGAAYGTSTGDVELRASTGAPIDVVVEQQVDLPLVEPPLSAMSAPDAEVIARGTFEPVDQSTMGEVRLYRLADGRHVLRVEDFFVTPNVDLELRLSTVAEITTSEEYLVGESVHVADLDVTAGSFNIPVAPDFDPAAQPSLVVWCEPVLSAYATVDLDWET